MTHGTKRAKIFLQCFESFSGMLNPMASDAISTEARILPIIIGHENHKPVDNKGPARCLNPYKAHPYTL